jgi:hypothetical protein
VSVDYVRGCRYAGVDADHAIVVHPGIASRPGILDSFCAYHADRGVDVWKLDARFSPEGWTEGLAAVGTHVALTARLPVFIVGSSRNASVVYQALQTSDVLIGAVLIGNASPLVSPEQLAQSLGQNTKPVFWIMGETDTKSGLTEARAAAAAGPVEMHTHRDDIDRLLMPRPVATSFWSGACVSSVTISTPRGGSNEHLPASDRQPSTKGSKCTSPPSFLVRSSR